MDTATRENRLAVFKDICTNLYNDPNNTHSYEQVVLLVMQTKYNKLLPEEMTNMEIANILNVSYKQVNFILKRLLGYNKTAINSAPKALLKKMAYMTNLKDSQHIEQHEPEMEYGTKI